MLKTETILEKKKTVETFDKIKVERYYKSQRLHHWVHVACMLVFFLTGLEIFIGMFFISDYLITRSVHTLLGIFIGVWDLFFFGFLLLKHKKLHEIIPTPRDFLDLIIITLCALKILPDSKYPHYDFYIVEEKRYMMKYHPAQKLLTTTNLLAIMVMGATGIVLYEQLIPGSTLILGVIAGLIVFPLTSLSIDFRFVHFVIFIYFITTTVIHFYFAIIPQNRQRLRGMVTGTEKIPIKS